MSLWRKLLLTWVLAGVATGLQAQSATAEAPGAACTPKPPIERSLFLRGSFSSWNADDKLRFAWTCDRYQLVADLKGEHRFKVADEGWKNDTDWGAEPPEGSFVLPFSGAGKRLVAVGAPMSARFDGTYRFALRMNGATPELSASTCPANAMPPANTPKLYLRGTPNNWTVLDEFAFRFSCDAYYLNVKLTGAHSFKVADIDWAATTSFGAPAAAGAGRAQSNLALKLVNGNATGGTQDVSYTFAGEHTIRLDLSTTPPTLSIGLKSFADPTAKTVSDPLALSLRFDSRNLAQRSPFGAVPAGSTVHFAIDAAQALTSMHLVLDNRRLEGNQELLDYTRAARLPMQMQRLPNGSVRYSLAHAFPKIGVYGYWFEAEINGQKFAYQNNSDAVFWTREKGTGGLGEVAELGSSADATSSVRRYRITVFDPAFAPPKWASDAVYYYIFPERFRNGNPTNDPKPGRDKYQNHTVELHERWNEPPFKPGTGDGSDAVFNNDFFGGDLAGIIQQLDYIQRTGANTLYLTPIFKAASNHKYDTADYMQVDPAFGTNAEFTRLTKEARKRGIRVMVDTSFNHTGSDSPYFDRFGNYGGDGAFHKGKINPKSPYASWYSFDATQTDPDKQFKGWVGIADLPELNKSDPTWRQFAYGAPNSVTRAWLKRGAAGWRMDVAPWVPDDFWREWRKVVKATDPEAMTISETWFDASKHVLGDMFDSTMNYIFRNTVLEFANGGNAAELYRNLEHLREAYPPQALHAMMNLLSGHDQARALHHLGWHDDKTSAEDVAKAKSKLLLATAFQFVYPGAPAVYYGDEVGVTGGDDPYNRATYPWKDKGGKPDEALLKQFQALAKLRSDLRVLRQGELLAPLYADATTLVLGRRMPTHLRKPGVASFAVVTLHNGAQAREGLSVALPPDFAQSFGKASIEVSVPARGHSVQAFGRQK
jgi:cyclomaltodextrinase / maltogenic alpha-amylase / neopullulanase